ncbi:PREDICTED: uncharacterized protein LOC104823805 isoform X2 [Tarenaya hassleriana]|uniref:uncharacterized protein LOC104823805 isoform X2 n=1 Tax=Tarenaya hassleriana TaxID=28532 RepID=UPI00053C9273|nr:PREDICTED: uncharacterized protein LOC104823805 isoform X2 [Tarenaya hassleriana]
MEGPAMDWKTEEYPPHEGDDKMAWVWSKGVSLGKKFLVAGVVMSSAPLIVPPLVVVSTIAMISSVPYCLFLTSYACTQKLMNTLLPSSAYDGESEEFGGVVKDEFGFEEDVMEDNKHGHVDGEGITGVDEAETVTDMDKPSPVEVNPILIQVEGEEVTVADTGEEPTFQVTDIFVAAYERPGVPENEEMEKETRKLIESIRDEGRTDKVHGRTLEKALQEDEKPIVSSEVKSEKVGESIEDLPEKKEGQETINPEEKGEADIQKLEEHEGEHESTVTETSTSTGKDEETIPSEPLDQAVDAPHGTGEAKRKNSNKKKRKTGRSGGVQ